MMKRNYRTISEVIILVGIMSATLVGCAPAGPPTARNVQNGSIIEVTLDDGTRCAVFDGFKAGGLSCDWKNK